MWIDSHCHLNHPRSEQSPSELINDAKKNGIGGLVTICCRISEEADQLAAISAAHDNVWHTIGTHPHDAGQSGEIAITQEQITSLVTQNPKAIGVGETGLDYFYNNASELDQKESFRKNCRAAIDANVPVIIHARDADDDVAKILKEESQGGRLKGLLHCFSSGEQLAIEALEIGFYISFSGIITFGAKSDNLREIAAKIPKDRLLVETDAPFLAPKPFRGKTNTPSYVQYTGKKLAEIHNIDTENMAKITTENFFTLFTKAHRVGA